MLSNFRGEKGLSWLRASEDNVTRAKAEKWRTWYTFAE
jgi:hypothetical protein